MRAPGWCPEACAQEIPWMHLALHSCQGRLRVLAWGRHGGGVGGLGVLGCTQGARMGWLCGDSV